MVGDTIPHVKKSSKVFDQAADALLRRRSQHDRVSKRRRAKQPEIRFGDLVQIQNRRCGSKFLLTFKNDPWTVSVIKGTMITARKGGESVTRNI
ncbi:hypothetical protein NDU88_001134 [Pleurodeles waltl]|uniref:Uncharacterized protein n=1 Tax=Pleurodeles waltl TaxID=8319 RepID=A0AAV7V7C2_PLEWA|nr:hypothetical protein NDU88_001134 [Pleurodeles waltl]